METKSQKIRAEIKSGNDKKALAIAARMMWRRNQKETSSKIIRAHECLVNPKFYKSLGIDVDNCILSGIETLKKHFMK